MVSVLTGRIGDLRAIWSHLTDCGAVVVVGSPGVGKTSLLRQLAGHAEGAVLASAYATLQWLPYFPLTAVVGNRLHLEDPVGVAMEVRSRVGSGVLLLDDAQWADPETQQVLPLLVGFVRLIVAVRSDERDAETLVATLAAAGAKAHVLEPLDPTSSAALVRKVRPGIGPRRVSEITRRAAGNPLLLTELARFESAPTLERRVAAVVRELSGQALADLEGLTVMGHPVPVSAIDATRNELSSTGMVTIAGGTATIAHPLLGEILLGQTSRTRRTEAHAWAAALPLPGEERAYHLVEAGQLSAAYDLATAVLAEEGSSLRRAAALALAGRCAPRERASELKLAAVEAYLAVGAEERADQLVEEIQPRTTAERFQLGILESQTAWAVGDDGRSLAAAERASRLLGAGRVATDKSTEAQLSVQLALTRHALLAARDLRRAVAMSRSAVATASAAGSDQLGRAQYLLGTALSMSGDPGYQCHLDAAIKQARRAGDHDLEMRAGNNLVASHELAGNHALGRRLAGILTVRARDLHLEAHVAQFRAARANLDVLDGWVARALTLCDDVLAGVLEPRTRDQLEVTRSIALLDMGRFEEARAQIATSMGTSADDTLGRDQFAYLDAETEWMLDRPEKCLAKLDRLEPTLSPGGELLAFARLTRSRALTAMKRPCPTPDDPWPAVPFFRAAPVEVDALLLAQADRHNEAAHQFATAARLWKPHYLRSSLVCTRQAATQQMRGGDVRGAVASLEASERVARRRGMAWELGQIRRVLRMAGARRSAPVVATTTGLTARETEVLGLAAEGVSNHEITARLGISRRTVETQLASANAKLGTRSRGTASARLSRP
jgi:DNA-binding CsgD family transcriptional regulator